MISRLLSLLLILLAIVAAPAASQRGGNEPGITGEVRSPDGSPVTGGVVALQALPANRITAAIDRSGRFRVVPDTANRQQLFISVAGYAPYQAIVSVPASRRMTLPPITLDEATDLRARFVSADGEPLSGAGLRRLAIDQDGMPIADPLNHTREQVDTDGTLTIGPFPRGRLIVAVDRAPFAPTRLPDVAVGGSGGVIDRGTIVIQPAARLFVDIVDENGRPVPGHDVWLEETAQPSPLLFMPAKTDARGRASFDRLGSSRYRVWTRTVDRCGGQPLAISRLASASRSPTTATRIVVGGHASVRIHTPVGPLLGRAVSLAPDAPSSEPWRPRYITTSLGARTVVTAARQPCRGVTDNDGRVTVSPLPPGPAELRVELFNSTYVTRVNVPERPVEIAVDIPDGLIAVRVVDRASQRAVARAQLVWVGGGTRVEGWTTANGDALLEGVGGAGGTLTVSASDYQTVEGGFDTLPDTPVEVSLQRLPASRIQVRVVDTNSNATTDAVVALIAGGGQVPQFAGADPRGIAAFVDVPRGPLRISAYATGVASDVVTVTEDRRADIAIAVKRDR